MNIQKAVADLLAKLEGWEHGLLLLLPNIVLAIVVVVLFWLFAKAIDRLLRKLLLRFSVGHEVIDLTAILVFLVVTVLGIFIALNVIGLDKAVASLLAGVGILALAIGLALRATGENYVAGIYLSIQRPFRVGQVVGSNDYFGIVERITLRSTWLRVPQGQLVHLPNRKVFENPIVNYSDSGLRRVDIEGRMAYTEDLERARRVAIEAVSAMETRTAGREVELFYIDFEAGWIEFELRFWIDFSTQLGYRAARSEAIMRIQRAFDAAGIVIPYPIRTLDFARGLDGGTLQEQLRGAGISRDQAS